MPSSVADDVGHDGDLPLPSSPAVKRAKTVALSADPNRVSVIGMGRLGLCQALTMERAGYDVLGCDVFPPYVDSINERTLQSDEPGVVAALQASTRLRATLSLEEAVDHSDLIMVVVATPTGIGEHAYDCGTLSKVLEDIAKLRRRDKHVVICCTVLPGYIANVASALLDGCAGCTISYNPEFIAQGDIMKGLDRPDIVLIGEGSTAAGDRLQAVHECASSNTPRMCRMSAASAEIAKLALSHVDVYAPAPPPPYAQETCTGASACRTAWQLSAGLAVLAVPYAPRAVAAQALHCHETTKISPSPRAALAARAMMACRRSTAT